MTTYRERILRKSHAAWSVEERQRYESLAERGEPLTRKEVKDKIADAWSVSERQFYERMLDDMNK